MKALINSLVMEVLKSRFSHIMFFIYIYIYYIVISNIDIFFIRMTIGTSTNAEDLCFVDNATTHTILKFSRVIHFSLVW